MSVRTTSFRLTLAAAAVATAFSAYAQQAPLEKSDAPTDKSATPDQQPKIQTVEVKGTASTYDPRRDDTASKIVVNHDEIVKHGDTNVLDVLKRLPGVTVSGGAGRGGEVRMRGLGSGYTQILINGERAPAGFSMDSLAPDVIERIEVMRAASAEFSTQAVAGTINIVLKKAIKNAQRELKAGIASGNGFIGPNANLQLSDR
ncbi:MAG: TonB-dependent receptor plug domain-containing protein, partial [Telluria sp.]